MKRFGNLFTQLCSIENIEYAHNRAKRGKAHYTEVIMVENEPEKRGKAHYTEVIMVENEPEKYFNIIHEQLLNKTFKNSKYTVIIKVY